MEPRKKPECPNYQSEMNESDPVLGIVRELITGGSALHNAIVWMLHVSFIYFTNHLNNDRIMLLSLFALTVLTLFSLHYLFVPWFTIDNMWDVSISDSSCKWVMVTTKLSFIYPKTIGVYPLYIERLFYLFKTKPYQFKAWQKKAIRLMLLGWTLLVSYIVVQASDEGYIYHSESNTCFPRLDLSEVVTMLCIDFTVCNTIIAMYCRRLIIYNSRQIHRIMRHEDEHFEVKDDDADPAEDCDFTVMAKSTVLTFVSCLSTQLAVLSWTVMGSASMWAAIDSAVNCWCIVLLFDLYENLFRLYHFCCCVCNRLLCYECIQLCSCHYLCKVQDGMKDIKAQPDTELTVKANSKSKSKSHADKISDVLIALDGEQGPCDNAREAAESKSTSIRIHHATTSTNYLPASDCA